MSTEIHVDRKNITDRIQKKINSSDLKPEEIQAIDKARSQVYTQTSLGGFFGAVGTFFFGRKRKFSPLFMIPFVGTGFFVGSQLGMISGIMSGKRTIDRLPNQERLYKMVRDIQMEVMHANGYTQDEPRSKPRPMTAEERRQYEQSLLDESSSSHNSSLNRNNDNVSFDRIEQKEQEQNDQPWWVNNNSEITNDDATIWKDDGDTYNNNANNNDTNGTSAWDRVRQNSK